MNSHLGLRPPRNDGGWRGHRGAPGPCTPKRSSPISHCAAGEELRTTAEREGAEAEAPLLLNRYGVNGFSRQIGTEAALVILGDDRALDLVALVEEGDPEGKADVAEDLGVFGPGDHRARAHDR